MGNVVIDGFVDGPNEGRTRARRGRYGSAIKALLNLRILVRSLHVSQVPRSPVPRRPP